MARGVDAAAALGTESPPLPSLRPKVQRWRAIAIIPVLCACAAALFLLARPQSRVESPPLRAAASVETARADSDRAHAAGTVSARHASAAGKPVRADQCRELDCIGDQQFVLIPNREWRETPGATLRLDRMRSPSRRRE